jgi:hypothetical protein
LKEKSEVAAAETEHNNGNYTDTALTDRTTIYVAGSVLESTFGDQARAGDVLTDTILHRRQQRSSVARSQQQQETTHFMDHQADTTPVRRTTRSVIPFSPPRGDDVSLARLKNVEQNDDSLAPGSLYHHHDNDVDNNEGLTDVNVAPGESNSITLIVGRGGGRGRGHGCGRGGGRGASVPEEDYTGMKVAFPPDTSLWPECQCLSDHIHKNKRLTMYNWMPPPGRDSKDTNNV